MQYLLKIFEASISIEIRNNDNIDKNVKKNTINHDADKSNLE